MLFISILRNINICVGNRTTRLVLYCQKNKKNYAAFTSLSPSKSKQTRTKILYYHVFIKFAGRFNWQDKIQKETGHTDRKIAKGTGWKKSEIVKQAVCLL